MNWLLTIAALGLASGLHQSPPLSEDVAPPSSVQSDAVAAPRFLVSAMLTAPVNRTDPQHLATSIGLSHAGAFRIALQYQPSNSGVDHLGVIHTALGVRLLRRDNWQFSIDGEHSQARPVRRLFEGEGWDLDGHERSSLSIGIGSLRWRERRFFGLVDAVELGFGRMHIWRRVSARVGAVSLNSPVQTLESKAQVGILGVHAGHRLVFGLDGQLRLRVIGAGNSRGGEIPFAHMTAEWDVTRELFHSKMLGRVRVGLTGTHATNPHAVTYFQNGLGLVFRAAF